MTEVICDIGINHGGDLRIAHSLIDVAREYHAQVAKFQLYDVDKLFPDRRVMARGFNYYQQVKGTELSFEQAEELAEHCREVGVEFMASAFDAERVGWCERLGVKRHKVASRSVREPEVLKAVAATGKPVIISLGMWHEREFPKLETSAPVSYLYCVSEYPTPLEHIDLEALSDETRGYQGFSDHTIGIDAALMAAALGMEIIEHHLTFNKYAIGPDHILSWEPRDLRHFMSHLRCFKRMTEPW